MSKRVERKRAARDTNTANFDLILQAAEIVERESKSCSPRPFEQSPGRVFVHQQHLKNNGSVVNLNDGYEADSETAFTTEKRPSLLRKHFAVSKTKAPKNESEHFPAIETNGASVVHKATSHLDIMTRASNHVQPIKPPRGRPALVIDELESRPKHRRTSANSPRFGASASVSPTHHLKHKVVTPANSATAVPIKMSTPLGNVAALTVHAPGLMDRDAREMHNISEKNRRAHLKNCFEELRERVPNMVGKRCSNLTILKGAGRYMFALNRRNREYEAELQQLVLEKAAQTKSKERLLSRLSVLGVDEEQMKRLMLLQREADAATSASAAPTPTASALSNGHRKSLVSGSFSKVGRATPVRARARSDSATNSDHGIDQAPSNSNSSTSTASEGEEGEDREDEATDEASEYGDIEPPPEFLRNLPFRKRFHRLIHDVDGNISQNGSSRTSLSSESPRNGVSTPPVTIAAAATTTYTKSLIKEAAVVSTVTTKVETTPVTTPDSAHLQLNPQFFNQNMNGVYKLLANVQQKERQKQESSVLQQQRQMVAMEIEKQKAQVAMEQQKQSVALQMEKQKQHLAMQQQQQSIAMQIEKQQQQITMQPVTMARPAVTVSQRSLIATLTTPVSSSAASPSSATPQMRLQSTESTKHLSLLPGLLNGAPQQQQQQQRTVATATLDVGDLSRLLGASGSAATAPVTTAAPSTLNLTPELLTRLLATQQIRQLQATPQPLILTSQSPAPAQLNSTQLLQNLIQQISNGNRQPQQQQQQHVFVQSANQQAAQTPIFLVPVVPAPSSSSGAHNQLQVSAADLTNTANLMNLLSGAVMAASPQHVNKNSS